MSAVSSNTLQENYTRELTEQCPAWREYVDSPAAGVLEKVNEMWRWLRLRCRAERLGSQRLFWSGFCPHETKDEDVVFVPCGGDVLFGVRRGKQGTYVLIGECYVHGIMDGKVMDKGI